MFGFVAACLNGLCLNPSKIVLNLAKKVVVAVICSVCSIFTLGFWLIPFVLYGEPGIAQQNMQDVGG